jgi:superfamily II DNA/RNA helicase
MKSKNQLKSKPKKNENEKKEPNPSISLLDSSIKEVLNQLGYEKLTHVQEKMVKELLNLNDSNINKNIICKSPKNSGKILSFLLPLTNKIIENEKKNIIERYIIITGIKERVHELYSTSKELLRDINGKKSMYMYWRC